MGSYLQYRSISIHVIYGFLFYKPLLIHTRARMTTNITYYNTLGKEAQIL